MTKMNKLLAPALGAMLAVGFAAPASANYYDDPRQIRAEIRELDRQIERAARSGQVSERNATWLSYRLQGVRNQFRQFSYRGFDDWEMSTLNHSIQIMETELQRRSGYGARRGYRGAYHDGNRGYRQDRSRYRGARDYKGRDYRGRDYRERDRRWRRDRDD